MHILYTVLYTFPKVLTRRTCSAIMGFSSWWTFPHSHNHNVWFRGDIVSQEKFDSDHSKWLSYCSWNSWKFYFLYLIIQRRGNGLFLMDIFCWYWFFIWIFLWQVCSQAITGDCRNRWFDKSVSIIVFKSGRLATHCDVSNLCTILK